MENSDTGKTILAADDSAVARALLSRLLKGAGYRVVTAADGIEAAQQAYRVMPDLIILDITMPRMNGYQVCRLLKRDPAVAHIPVIILTGADSRGTEFWSLRTGADAFHAQKRGTRRVAGDCGKSAGAGVLALRPGWQRFSRLRREDDRRGRKRSCPKCAR